MRTRYLLTLVAAATLVAAPMVLAQPAEGPTLASPEETLVPPPATEVAPAIIEAAPAAVCCPIEVLRETALPSARHAYRCYGQGAGQVLCVDNPADCTGKLYSVPVCVPACCVGEPVCCGTKVGLLGRGYVTYRWSCGFEATIVFRVHGGVLITYK